MQRPRFNFSVLPLLCLVAFSSIVSNSLLSAAETPAFAERIEVDPQVRQIGELDWYTDYTTAYKEAKSSNQQLLICFELQDENAQANFEESILADAELQAPLQNFVRAILPLDAAVPGERQTLLWHPSFQYMYKQAGFAILDLRDENSSVYGQLVSAHPFNNGRACTRNEFQIALSLPDGTITQRTLIFALKCHPERPQSVNATPHAYLMNMSNVNSSTMARLSQVGHHNWTSRFHQINGAVGGLSSEVAVSGDGYTLLDIARDCIRTWRSSSGHWSSMSRPHRYYGYDMVQGSNGTWYATGIFVD